MCKMKELFDSPEFEKRFHCGLPLGAFPSPDGTLFRLWAPTAERVVLRLYPTGDNSEAEEVHPLLPEGGGTWVWESGRDLDGTYYDFEVTVDGISPTTADPYARACGLNGLRSMAVDLRRTDPPGWENDAPPSPAPETVIYEIHVKDFSWAPHCGVSPELRGKYLALCRENTTLDGDGKHPTCLNYLKRLGVTHVQLMPVYDYGSVDEGGGPEQFNWDYDPMNYNVPDGSACGNDLATERSMCARYILDSVLYWAQEYHMDGFRFDLMGLLDVKLKESIRDAVKGPISDEKANIPGFVNGGGLDGNALLNCVRGWTGKDGPFAAPSQTINYLSWEAPEAWTGRYPLAPISAAIFGQRKR